jgi:hypothetical protein
MWAIWEYSPKALYHLLIQGDKQDWSEKHLLEALRDAKGRLNKLQEILLYAEAKLGILIDHMTALKSGLTVYYTSLARLIEDLKLSSQQNRLEKRWRVYLRPAILIIDEVGYMQLNRQEAELLFRLVSERYEHGSIILTSNKYFSDWGELLNDTVIATALLDRLLHHSHVINIRGQTYRLKDRLKSGVQVTPPANVPAVG